MGRLKLRRLHLAWLLVFLVNMTMPLQFGWSLTDKVGRSGLLAASLLLLALGGFVCVLPRRIGPTLIVGAACVAFTQFFPLLQLFAGMLSLGLGQLLGQVEEGRFGPPGHVSSELGGFLVTATTGGLLMVASLVVGVVIRLLIPGEWWGDPAEDGGTKTRSGDFSADRPVSA